MDNKKLRIAFMGTPEFSVPALNSIIDAGHDVVCVYSQPPRPSGRGHKTTPSPVHKRAEELGIEVKTPKSLKTDEAQKEFADLNLDIAVVVAYGLILPKAVLNAPKYGCLNIHASLLPRWRGAAPIQRAILAGDTETGVSIMQMDEGLDTGPELLRGILPITSTTTTPELHDSLSSLGAKLITEVLNHYKNGAPLAPVPQKEDGMTYAKMLKKEEGLINWAKSSEEIDRQIRALTPWPGVWCMIGNERLKVLQADPSTNKATEAPGTIIKKDLSIACGQGTLTLVKVQPANRKPMDGISFLNGSSINIGDKLS